MKEGPYLPIPRKLKGLYWNIMDSSAHKLGNLD
jgi:hypothetical protein